MALNADIVGYSKLLADDFEATAAAMEDYHQLVQERPFIFRSIDRVELLHLIEEE